MTQQNKNQQAYIDTILQRFQMSTAYEVQTPLDPNVRLDGQQGGVEVDPTQYQAIVGSLITTRIYGCRLEAEYIACSDAVRKTKLLLLVQLAKDVDFHTTTESKSAAERWLQQLAKDMNNRETAAEKTTAAERTASAERTTAAEENENDRRRENDHRRENDRRRENRRENENNRRRENDRRRRERERPPPRE
jgi:acetyl/propionyl-CoA carboxylase alpha subunit